MFKSNLKNNKYGCPNETVTSLLSLPPPFFCCPRILFSLHWVCLCLFLRERGWQLPNSAFIHFWGGVWQVVVVSASIERERGKGRVGTEHVWRHAVQRAWDAGLRAGRVARVVGHDVGEALDLAGRMMARDGMVHAPEGGPGGAWRRHEWEVYWGLGLGGWGPLREEVVVPTRTVVISLIIWRLTNGGESKG